ncbi:unnamed protein product [Victoria cruziana]
MAVGVDGDVISSDRVGKAPCPDRAIFPLPSSPPPSTLRLCPPSLTVPRILQRNLFASSRKNRYLRGKASVSHSPFLKLNLLRATLGWSMRTENWK